MIAALRRDAAHQLTTRLVRDFDTIVIEDPCVAGMLRNRGLARHIADAGWAEIRRQFTYKTKRAGARLVVADRWFASSKTCSGCGTAKAKLTLSEREYLCLACGIVLDRDHNAAINLAALAAGAGESRREQPDRTDVRRARLAGCAVGSLREGPQAHRATTPRRWLDERDRTSHFIERYQPASGTTPTTVRRCVRGSTPTA